MTPTLKDFTIPELGEPRRGKVRDIYELGDRMVMIASDRISCFDRILNQPIPSKGQVLTEISVYWFQQTEDIVPNHLIEHPHGNVMLVERCRPLPVEIVVRGYMAGSMWRDYKAGKREKCGVALPEGLSEGTPLPQPIVTPTTKAAEGHDEDISREQLIAAGTLTEELWDQLETIALKLYTRGNAILNERGLILVDTKYEFGLASDGTLTLIDEIHTPDSSRFWFTRDQQTEQLRYPDKEFVRGKLMELGFSGEGSVPDLPEEVINETTQRYISVYETLLGRSFRSAGSLIGSLKEHSLLSGCFVQILAESETERQRAELITEELRSRGTSVEQLTVTDHHNPLQVVMQQNSSLEPVIYVAVEGDDSRLAEIIAANTRWPVLACTAGRGAKGGILSAESPQDCVIALARILKMLQEIQT